ncbi:MAG: hypothetical protein RJB13_2299 [Pseudomonadota bacterium]|jgi:magnesium-transporting ATPase (P-type)
MYRKIVALVITALLLPTQSFAREQQVSLKSGFNALASEVIEDGLNAHEIMERSKQLAKQARAEGMNESSLLKSLNDKLSLQLSPEEIERSVRDLRTNPTEEKLEKIAQDIVDNQNGDKVFMVLLTFALMSLLLVGFFFLIADPHYPH